MLTDPQKEELVILAEDPLNSAESILNQVGDQLVFAANSRTFMRKLAESIETQIPGYPTVEPGRPKVDDFIAIVADMRDSTTHLLCAISAKTARVSQLQRVFYETATLLPCLAKVIAYENGNVTEYPGDGVLGIFCLNKKNKSETIYAANRAANKCINVVTNIVNPLLSDRFSLPSLEIGVGLAYSKAVVTLVGLADFMQPKVFGECVFRATKLSAGKNEVMCDKAMKCIWPSSNDGVLRFVPRSSQGVDGYLLKRSHCMIKRDPIVVSGDKECE